MSVYAQKLETCLTSLEIPQLGSFGSASVNADISDAAVVAEGVGDFEDLLRQLSGRSEHEDDGSVAALKRRLMLQVDHAGQTEGQRLSRTRLGDADHITAWYQGQGAENVNRKL